MIDQPLLLYNVMTVACQEYTFFIFARCETLKSFRLRHSSFWYIWPNMYQFSLKTTSILRAVVWDAFMQLHLPNIKIVDLFDSKIIMKTHEALIFFHNHLGTVHWKIGKWMVASLFRWLQSDGRMRMKCVSGLTGRKVAIRRQVLGRYQMQRRRKYKSVGIEVSVLKSFSVKEFPNFWVIWIQP